MTDFHPRGRRDLKLLEFLTSSTRTLHKAGVENPGLEAQVLLSTAFGIERARLFAAMDTELTEAQFAEAKRLVELRATRFPLQYITRTVEFLGLEFSLAPDVFIPRPETELLVLEARKRLEGLASPVILEIGTGSGVVAISLALENTTVRVHANDISAAAVTLAKVNARKHGVSERIFFHAGNLFSAIKPFTLRDTIDLLVSNPPYIPSCEIPSLAPEVSQHEPATAIDGGEDGLRYIRAILESGRAFLRGGGWVLLEIGVNQAVAGRQIAASVGLREISTVKDLSGIERVLAARKI